MRLNLIGGAYSARSVIANAQRCINYYPELNRRDAPVPMTLYQRPGRRALVTGAVPARVRGLYRASNGNGYCVIGQNVYSIALNWVLTLLGALVTPANTQVCFIDNGQELLLVDGSIFGYQIILATNAFGQVFDPTGTFAGANQVATLDTYTLWNFPGTKNFGSSLSGVLDFTSLYIAAKAAYPDPIMGLTVNRRELLLFGALKSEIWYDFGGANFPFAILPGAYIEHGCVATFSIASEDIDTYWLSQDLEGAYLVLKVRGYDVSRVSNHALEFALQQMVAQGADLSQAIGFCWQRGGHVNYTLTFPSGDQTWVYDASLSDDPTLAWHQESWQGADGPHRVRDNCHAFIYGQNVVGDHTNGTLYAIDESRYTDEVDGTLNPIIYLRSFPHIITAYNQSSGKPTDLDGKRVKLENFRLDMDVGSSEIPDQEVQLRWSWDRGKTFGNAILQPAGSPGQFLTQPLWTQIGATGRDCILEVSHQINGPAAIQGGWIDATALNT